jgi:hypothetical protein
VPRHFLATASCCDSSYPSSRDRGAVGLIRVGSCLGLEAGDDDDDGRLVMVMDKTRPDGTRRERLGISAGVAKMAGEGDKGTRGQGGGDERERGEGRRQSVSQSVNLVRRTSLAGMDMPVSGRIRIVSLVSFRFVRSWLHSRIAYPALPCRPLSDDMPMLCHAMPCHASFPSLPFPSHPLPMLCHARTTRKDATSTAVQLKYARTIRCRRMLRKESSPIRRSRDGRRRWGRVESRIFSGLH